MNLRQLLREYALVAVVSGVIGAGAHYSLGHLRYPADVAALIVLTLILCGIVTRFAKKEKILMATRGFEHLTHADIDRRNFKMAAPKPSKYRNVRTEVDGVIFDSKAESEYWLLLKGRVARGEITGLERQVKFPLMCPDTVSTYNGIRHHVCDYVADFVWWENGALVVADLKGGKSKGTRTRLYSLKIKWLALQTGIAVREV